ncbi:MAG TPA: class I SAM-dependent methyltransferase [Nonomuraea sp.]|nr:class I SAM-dependent methyltransferase [Nonomuraea sp.]
MNTEKIDARKIAGEEVTWTLLGTLYLRAWDSRQPRSILGDRYAAEALERIDCDFQALHRRLRPDSNQYLAALRGRQFDDWSAAFLTRHPDATVLHLGCGLDSRMLRLDPEGRLRWYDVDLPHVIDLRRRLYPEHDRYTLIGASVTDEGWLARVPADRPVLIVAEGLLPYLSPGDVHRLFDRLTGHFTAGGELVFDTGAPWLFRLVKIFTWPLRDGREVERRNPRLICAEQLPFTANHHIIPVRGYRVLYRLMNAVPIVRNMFRWYRFTL